MRDHGVDWGSLRTRDGVGVDPGLVRALLYAPDAGSGGKASDQLEGLAFYSRYLEEAALPVMRVLVDAVCDGECTYWGTVYATDALVEITCSHTSAGRTDLPDRCRAVVRTHLLRLYQMLDETTDDISLPQQLRHRECEVHTRDRITKLAREPELDHGGNEHRYGLTEGGGLSFDAADAPAENAQAVRGRRVGVGSHKRVKADDVSCGHRVGCDDLAEALYVELVADATSRGNDLDVLK